MSRRTTCRDVRLPSGEIIRVRGDQPMTEESAAALGEIVDAVRRQLAAEPPEVQAARAERQRAALDRLHGRTTRDSDPPISEGAAP